jgi:putative transposase
MSSKTRRRCINSDNSSPFIAKEFKAFIRICVNHNVITSPLYPQSNGTMERWYGTLKGECIRVQTSSSLEDARRLAAKFVSYSNTLRLHTAIAYVTPADNLAGRAEAIWTTRRQKLASANARRRARTKEKEAAQTERCAVH